MADPTTTFLGGHAQRVLETAAVAQAADQRNLATLEANAQHLLTDVWTSVGVVAGVGIVALTDWERLDPVVALRYE